MPDSSISQTLREQEQRFDAVSWETQVIQGAWRHQGARFRVEPFRVFVDVEDLPEHRRFFRSYKEQLKSGFRQLDVWLTTYRIEAL